MGAAFLGRNIFLAHVATFILIDKCRCNFYFD